MKPGDIVTSDNGMKFQIGEMLSYQGKADCDYAGCTRIPGEPGCIGYHCPRCHAPCSSMGHNCPESDAPSQEGE